MPPDGGKAAWADLPESEADDDEIIHEPEELPALKETAFAKKKSKKSRAKARAVQQKAEIVDNDSKALKVVQPSCAPDLWAAAIVELEEAGAFWIWQWRRP